MTPEEKERRVSEIYDANRPRFRDWGTLKQMCIASAIEYADEYAKQEILAILDWINSYKCPVSQNDRCIWETDKQVEISSEELYSIYRHKNDFTAENLMIAAPNHDTKYNKRIFKWYFIKDGMFPQEKEMVHFDDKNNIMHLGTFHKKDQFGRENVFVSTEGAHFTNDKVEAWISAPHSMPHENLLKIHAKSEAKARLMAAAPDLLKACQEMVKHLMETDFDVCGTREEDMNRWEAAIRKATYG